MHDIWHSFRDVECPECKELTFRLIQGGKQAICNNLKCNTDIFTVQDFNPDNLRLKKFQKHTYGRRKNKSFANKHKRQ